MFSFLNVVVSSLIRDRLQIYFLILGEFKQINQVNPLMPGGNKIKFHLKLWENHRFF